MVATRREFMKAAGAGAAGLSMLPWLSSCTTPARRPNIVFIYADDLDFDQMHASCYPVEKYPCFSGAKLAGKLPDYYLPEGWDPYYFRPGDIYTPNIDALAKQGAHFSRFYITSTMCTPSRYSLLTGRYAHNSPDFITRNPRHRPASVEWTQEITAEEQTIARHLKSAGYHTAIIGKWHNGAPEEAYPHRIFKEHAQNPGMLREKLTEAQRIGCEHLRHVAGFDFAEHICFGNADRIGGHNLPWYTESVLNYLDRDHRQPFFLYFPLPVPHGCGGGSEFNKDLRMSLEGPLEKVPDSQPPIDDVYRRIRKTGHSDRSISFTWLDDCIGAVMKKLDERGLSDNTILVVTSDHQSRGKFSCYEGARVPCIVRWPGVVEPGSRIDTIHANIDIVPTLLEIAGVAARDRIDGTSFAQHLNGTAAPGPERALLLEAGYSKAVVKGDYKYIANRPPAEIVRKMQAEAKECPDPLRRNVGWDGEVKKGRDPRFGVRQGANQFFTHYFDPDQLYDLRDDVFEQDNRAAHERDTVTAMKEELRKLLADTVHPFGEFVG